MDPGDSTRFQICTLGIVRKAWYNSLLVADPRKACHMSVSWSTCIIYSPWMSLVASASLLSWIKQTERQHMSMTTWFRGPMTNDHPIAIPSSLCFRKMSDTTRSETSGDSTTRTSRVLLNHHWRGPAINWGWLEPGALRMDGFMTRCGISMDIQDLDWNGQRIHRSEFKMWHPAICRRIEARSSADSPKGQKDFHFSGEREENTEVEIWHLTLKNVYVSSCLIPFSAAPVVRMLENNEMWEPWWGARFDESTHSQEMPHPEPMQKTSMFGTLKTHSHHA